MAENHICDYYAESKLPTVMLLVVMLWWVGAETSGVPKVSYMAQIFPLFKDSFYFLYQCVVDYSTFLSTFIWEIEGFYTTLYSVAGRTTFTLEQNITLHTLH